jgi:hypothetical protein
MLIVSMGSDYVSEFRPLTGLLFTPRIIYEYVEPRWNDIDRGKPKKSLLQSHFVHYKSHMDWPGENPGISGEIPATNRLSHDTGLISLS